VLSRKGNAPSGFEEVDWCVSASAKRTLHKRKIEVRNVGFNLLERWQYGWCLQNLGWCFKLWQSLRSHLDFLSIAHKKVKVEGMDGLKFGETGII
jgi:hypothetical protein